MSKSAVHSNCSKRKEARGSAGDPKLHEVFGAWVRIHEEEMAIKRGDRAASSVAHPACGKRVGILGVRIIAAKEKIEFDQILIFGKFAIVFAVGSFSAVSKADFCEYQ